MAVTIKGFASDWSVPEPAKANLDNRYAALDAQGRQPVRKGELVVNAADYGVKGDGVTDDRVALQSALSATPNGGRLFIPPGTYFISGVLSGSGRTCTIDAYGAKLLISGTHNALTWTGGFGQIHAVSSLTATTASHNNEPVAATRLTTTGTPSVSRGDVVKLVSDTWIPGARRGDGTNESRVGEFMVVDSVDGSDIIVIGAPRETYTGSVRVARLLPYTIHIRGLGFESTNPALSSWAMVGLSNLMEPTVRDCVAQSVGGPGFHLTGCYGYTVEQCTVANAVNSTSTGNLGYGVLDNSCDHGRVIGLKARHVRHAYTDDSPRIASTSALTGYGRTYGTQIINGHALGNTGTAWSTHAASESVEFINCQAVDCLQGFGLRGRKHFVKGGYSRGGGHGLFILTEEWGSDTWGHTVDGLVIEGAKNIPIFVNQNGSATPNPGVRELRAHKLRNISIEAWAGTNAGLRAINTTLDVESIRVNVPPSMPSTAHLLSFANSDVSLTGVILDTSKNTEGSVSFFNASGGAQMSCRGLTVKNTSSSAAREYVLLNTTSDTVDFVDAVYAHRPAGLVLETADIANVVHDYVSRLDGGHTSAAAMQVSSDFSRALRMTRRDFTAYVQGTSYQDIAPLPNGRRLGQKLQIINLGSGSLGVPHGTGHKTQLVGGAARTIPSAGSVTLVWTGSVWQQGADASLFRGSDGVRYRIVVGAGGTLSTVAV